MDEQYLGAISEGMSADVLVPGRPKALAANLYYIAPKVDPRTGGAKIRLRFNVPVADLRSGLTADINLVVERRTEALTVARSAILGRDAGARVLVVNEALSNSAPLALSNGPVSA